MKINIVLFQPEIPQNTGNIARTCSATGSALHLVHPLGFSIDERHLRRAGLDYWDGLEIHQYESDEQLFSSCASKPGFKDMWYFSQKGRKSYWEAEVFSPSQYEKDQDYQIWLAFGCESHGLDENMLIKHREHCVRIPMLEGKRSLNLSNCVAVAVYEVLRRAGFEGLVKSGQLNERRWEDTDE